MSSGPFDDGPRQAASADNSGLVAALAELGWEITNIAADDPVRPYEITITARTRNGAFDVCVWCARRVYPGAGPHRCAEMVTEPPPGPARGREKRSLHQKGHYGAAEDHPKE